MHIIELIERDPDSGEWEFDIIHEDDCPKSEQDLGDFTYVSYECGVGIQLNWSGLESLFSEPLPDEPGKYVLEAWATQRYVHYYGTWEYDSGLTITGKLS